MATEGERARGGRGSRCAVRHGSHRTSPTAGLSDLSEVTQGHGADPDGHPGRPAAPRLSLGTRRSRDSNRGLGEMVRRSGA